MILTYDGSFEGFLSVVFECYSQKIEPTDICSVTAYQEQLFCQKQFVHSNKDHAKRVWKAWQNKLSTTLNQLPYLAYLSNEKGMETKLFHFAQKSFSSKILCEQNFGDSEIMDIRLAARKVSQEAMRMIQFTRFQQTSDFIYFSALYPRYDVLPMTIKHFRDRFADQQWVIYDLKRDYGFYYNLKKVDEISIDHKEFNIVNGSLSSGIVHESEAAYQSMWSNYCKNITIKERLNLKVQKQHMPKRYWKFLTEKK